MKLDYAGALVFFQRLLTPMFFALSFPAIFYRYRRPRRRKAADRALEKAGSLAE